MKILISREELLHALQLCRPLWKVPSINPVSYNVLLAADERGVVLAATDLDMYFTRTLREVEVHEQGRCAINAQRLYSVLTNLPGDLVTLAADPKYSVATLEAGRCIFEFAGIDYDEFPKAAVRTGGTDVTLSGEDFADAIRKVGRGIAQEKGRYALNGVLIEPGKHGMGLTATCGRRLAHCKIPAKGKRLDEQAVVPRKAYDLIAAACRGEMLLQIGPDWLEAVADGTTVQSCLVDGQFPDWRSVVPREFGKRFVVGREAFATALRQAQVMASIESQGTKFSLEPGLLTLRSKSPGGGEACVAIEVETDWQADLCFDAEYVLPGLGGFDSERITFEFNDNESAAIIHAGDKAQHFYLVMPIDN